MTHEYFMALIIDAGFLVPGSWFLVPGSGFRVPGSMFPCPRSWGSSFSLARKALGGAYKRRGT